MLFCDAIYLPTRPSGGKVGVLVAWGYDETGQRALLDVVLGQRERFEGWLEMGRDLVRRGLRVPRRGRLVQGRVQAEPGDERDRRGQAAAARQQRQRGVGAVRHRSRVSSTPKTSGPSAAKAATSEPTRIRLLARLDHLAWLSTRW